MIDCPDCRRESLDDARFCASCGAPLRAPEAAREERKVVSVVFVDLVGHTARSESADPEDVRATLAPYYARVRSELERFGGTVEKFIGDAVMAVFGAPVSHEDDPERAVRAALAVREAMVEDGLDVRVAVNTGEALVSLGARPDAGEAIIAGDVVNTAARLQSSAPVNGVLVGETTHRATERVIEYRAAEPVDAKGKAAAVPAWEAVAPRARFGVDVVQHGGAALVGREAERRLLWDAFERARREQTLQVVTLVGVPGIGKSRLVWELFRQVDEDRELAYWRQGRALAYGGGPGGAVAEAVRAHLGGIESDAPADVERKLTEAVAALPLEEQDRTGVVRRLAPLLGVETDELSSRDEAFSSWRRFFEALAEQRPLVLVLEDLHWADDSTLDFVDYLADWATDVPMLVVATARPELLERRPTWGGGRLNSHTLALAPLDERATAELLARLLDRPVIDADVQARLLQQSGGNPLYTEEFARMVGEGIAEVPDSVQGIIAARLDLLEPREKELLHDAAVLGKVFWRDGVQALGATGDLDEALRRLVRKEFVRRERGSSIAGDVEYAFRHGLVRDVAYGQIPRAARVEKHRRAAEWVAGSTAARPDLVAHHYSEALDLARSAGADTAELAASARQALREAADRARSVGALVDAVELYARALDLWPQDDERDDVLLSVGVTASDTSHEGAAGWLEEAIERFTERGDLASVSRAEVARATLEWSTGNGVSAHEHLQRAVTAAQQSGSERALATALSVQGRLLGLASRSVESIAASEQALELAERLGLEEEAIVALTALGVVRGESGEGTWRQDLEEALERALAINAPMLELRARNNLGHTTWQQQGPGAALPIYEAAWRSVYANRLPFNVRWVESVQTSVKWESGRWDEALEHADTFARLERGSPHYLDGDVLRVRAEILFARDRAEEATALGAQALARAREVGDLQAVAPALARSAGFMLAQGQSAEADALVAELEGLPSAARWILTMWFGDIGWLQHDTGRPLIDAHEQSSIWARINVAIVEGRWEEATTMLDEIEARTGAAYARLRLARRLAAEGGDPEPWLSEAETFYRGVRAMRYLRELDELRARRRSA